jgi:hypothetical protein
MKSETVRNLLLRLGLPSIAALTLWLLVDFWLTLNSPISVLLNIEGTFLLAAAISFPQGPNKLQWFFESANYGNTPSFSYPNFYLGLASLTLGIVLGATK